MIDNFKQITELLSFDSPEEFYFLQIIQRRKDTKGLEKDLSTDSNNRLIKAYYIYSVEQLEKYKVEIIAMCNLFQARACINLNKRNAKKVALEQLAALALDIKVGHYSHGARSYNTICGLYKGDSDKIWIIDLDRENNQPDLDWTYYVQSICNIIENMEPKKGVITTIPSRNGIHLITHAFNSKQFADMNLGIEVHKNNPTNLYIP